MHKIIICSFMLSCISLSSHAQHLTKEGKKQVLEQLKEYKKNPEAYKRMITKYKETIDSDQITITQMKGTIHQLSMSNGDLLKKNGDLDAQLTDCLNKPVPKCPDLPAAGASLPESGDGYKVQIGLFKNMNMAGYLTEAKSLSLENAGGKYRYVIGYFADKAEAVQCVTDMKKLGIKGAFIAKYENGERVGAKKSAKPKKTE